VGPSLILPHTRVRPIWNASRGKNFCAEIPASTGWKLAFVEPSGLEQGGVFTEEKEKKKKTAGRKNRSNSVFFGRLVMLILKDQWG
jgi:hypothetical protein